MFKMTLLKHFMPIALSVSMVVQSLPATALAAEQSETVVEETVIAETDTNEEDIEVSETVPSTKEDVQEPAQDAEDAEPERVGETVTIVEDPITEDVDDEVSVSDGETEKVEGSIDEITDGETSNKEDSDKKDSDEEISNGENTTTEISETDKVEVEEPAIEVETVAAEESAVEESTIEDASEEEITEIDLKEAEELKLELSNSISVDLDFSSVTYNYENWVTFTAPENGTYNFYIENDSYYISTAIYRNKADKTPIANAYDRKTNLVYYLGKGETVFLNMSVYRSGVTVNVGVEKVTEGKVTVTDNGYKAETDTFGLDIQLKTGYTSTVFNVDLGVKEGAASASNYQLKTIYQKEGAATSNYSVCYLYSSLDYKTQYSIDLDMGSKYKVTMYLYDYNTGECLAALIPESSPITIETKSTDEHIVFGDIEAEFGKVTLNFECIEAGTYLIDYVPVSVPGFEEAGDHFCDYLGRGMQTVELRMMAPDTEHTVRFYLNGNKIAEKNVKTQPYPGTVTYDVKAAGADSINIKANISDYKGKANEISVGYEILDADKNSVIKTKAWNWMNMDDYSFDTTVSGLTASTAYTVKVWVTDDTSIWGNSDLEAEIARYEQKEYAITTANAAFSPDDITLTMKQNEQETTSADYTVEVKNATQDISGMLEYRIKESEWEDSQNITLTAGKASGTLRDLQAGAEYEIRLTIGGVVKTSEYTFGTAAYTPEISDDTGAFDSVLTYRLKESECKAGTTYTVIASLYRDGDGAREYFPFADKELTKENNYTVTVSTDGVSGGPLSPNSEYSILFVLRADNGTTTQTYETYRTIHTKETSLTAKPEAVGIDFARFKLSFAGMERVQDQDFRGVWIYLKEENGSYRNETWLGSSEFEYPYIYLNNLKGNTNYTVSLKNGHIPYAELGSFSFTTSKDNRTIRVNEVSENDGYIEIETTLIGGLLHYDNYISLYFREKGAENAWECYSERIYGGGDDDTRKRIFEIFDYNNADLKSGTTYEYVVGVGNSDSTPQDKLTGTTSGEFTTKADTKKFELLGSDAGYTYGTVAIKFTGDSQRRTNVRVYYKEKADTANAAGIGWTYVESSNDETPEKSLLNITNLKPGTTYEYVVSLGTYNSLPESPESIAADDKQAGELTTKKSDYKLSFERDDSNCTGTKETIFVTADGTGEDAEIYVTLHLTDKDGQSVAAKEVTLKQKSQYKNTVSFTGLLPATAYMIKSADIRVVEYRYGSKTVIDTITYDDAQAHQFTTKNDVTSIKLSQNECKLNLRYDNTAWLTVETEPANASGDVLWQSSDSAVVSVSSYGQINARGVGEAVITASSRTNPEIKDTCKVTVKDYAVQLADGDVISGGYSIAAKKGYFNTGIDLYDMSTGSKLTPDTNYSVTSSSERVAKWENQNGTYGVIADNVGYTNLTFTTTDGYRAVIEVHVTIDIKGFGITGLQNAFYPAVEKSENTYELAYREGNTISYYVNGMMNPTEESFTASDYTWTSSNPQVAEVEVSGRAIITPKSIGTAKITVTPKEALQAGTKENLQPVELTVEVKKVPDSIENKTLYAVTNTQTTLKDVTGLPDGWTWKEPETPIYSLPVNASYTFNAVAPENYYYTEEEITVFVGTITGVYVNEMLVDKTQEEHRGVLMVSSADAKDSLKLKISAAAIGSVSSSQYTTAIPEVKGLTIEQDKDSTGRVINGQYTITASQTGKFTLKPEIKVGDQTVAVGTYFLKAVTGNQIASITLSSNTAAIDAANNTISFDLGAQKDFELTAVALNRDKTKNEDTKLDWTVTDKSVAAIKVDKDTRTATVQVKGEGHAVIQVTAKDDAGISTQMNLEIKNYAPRVEGTKATVNMAFDYNVKGEYYWYGEDGKRHYDYGYVGRALSEQNYGAIEITSAYREHIVSVSVVDKDGITASDKFAAYGEDADYDGSYWEDIDHRYNYVIIPKSDNIAAGTYDCKLEIVTERGTYSDYPIKISVINKKPKVTAKLTKAMNLFYTCDSAEGTITLENGNYRIESLMWEDSAKAPNSSFDFYYDTDYDSAKRNVYELYIEQGNIKVQNGKLVNTGVDQGTLTVKLAGVKEAYTFEKFKVKWNYKKPALKTVDYRTGKNVSSIIPSMGATGSRFGFYNNTTKSRLYYNSDYDELICDNKNIAVEPYEDSYYVDFDYFGSNKQENVQFTLDSRYWREALVVKHTIKAIQPTAVIANSKLTYHTNYVNSVRTYISLKDYCYGIAFTDMAISGANDAANDLLKDDRLQIIHDGMYVYAKLNKLKFAGQTIPSGSYSYNLTPSYDGQALNTVKLTITFTDKPITAKVSAKGALDLAQPYNACVIVPKFSDLGSSYSITNAELLGEYSDYFAITHDTNNNTQYLSVSSYGRSKLKAGHTYNFAIVYTIRTSGGETFTVTSDKLKVKPKQTAPKVTVKKNNKILYAGSSVTKNYLISVPETYNIKDAYGSLDVNKDGRADIRVSLNDEISPIYGAYLKVEIIDRDAVIAAAKGKSYSIPVTVRVVGRDGISKDASVAIKVNIKR